MFSKKESGSREIFDTLIGVSTFFEGNIESEGTVKIDGRVKGDIKVNGDVFIGESAQITGNIYADNIHLSGTVEGNMRSTGVLKMLPTSKLYGDIHVNSFVADEGAIFQGKCSMADAGQNDKSPVKTPSRKAAKEYKKSSVLDQIYEEKESKNEVKDAE